MICEYGCNQKAKHQMSSGKWCCSSHWNQCIGKRQKDSIQKQGKVPWNKNKQIKGHSHSEETKKKLSVIAKNKKLGGYQKGSGRGKSGWYNGIWCDSTYELAFILYCLEENIPITRNTQIFKYNFEGKKRKYLPDFIRTDKKNYFIEIKGFITEQDKVKVQQFPYKLKFYCGRSIKNIVKQMTQKYGNLELLYGRVVESG